MYTYLYIFYTYILLCFILLVILLTNILIKSIKKWSNIGCSINVCAVYYLPNFADIEKSMTLHKVLHYSWFLLAETTYLLIHV